MTDTRLTEADDEEPAIVRTAADAVVVALRTRRVGVRRLRRRVVHLDGDADVRVGFDVVTVERDGTVRDDVVWAARVDGTAPPGTVDVTTADGAFGVWRHPHDPALPGLAGVVSGRCDVVHNAGVDVTDVEVVAVTPLHDATVRVGSASRAVYVKVVAPGAAAVLADVHTRLAAVGLPVPPVLGVDDSTGVVVLGELTGVPLAERCAVGGPVPDPAAVRALVAALADVDVGRDSPSDPLPSTLDRACARVTTADSGLGPRIDALRTAIDALPRRQYPATVHGDLHDDQILVGDDGTIRGLVDLDRVGSGDLADDLSRLLAHLRVRSLASPVTGAAIATVADTWHRDLAKLVGDDQLRHRSAIALVGLSTGPWRTGRPDWHDTLTRTLDEAERLLGRS